MWVIVETVEEFEWHGEGSSYYTNVAGVEGPFGSEAEARVVLESKGRSLYSEFELFELT
jgi:hypothetical protein